MSVRLVDADLRLSRQETPWAAGPVDARKYFVATRVDYADPVGEFTEVDRSAGPIHPDRPLDSVAPRQRLGEFPVEKSRSVRCRVVFVSQGAVRDKEVLLAGGRPRIVRDCQRIGAEFPFSGH